MDRRNVPAPIANDAALGDIWSAHHRYLLDVGYRMLGSVSEAEDVVQEAFIRLLRTEIDDIVDVRGWLVVIVTRLCLDQLRSARNRREVYVGPWLPEPVIAAPDQSNDPADRVTLDDSVRMAMLLVLERLSPAERAAFVLHDVFQFSFEEVAGIAGRTPAACRQLASRARRHVQAEVTPARFQVNDADLSHVADQFIAAATDGDLHALMRVLDPNVVGHTDSGGFVPAPRHLITGREKVAHGLLGFLKGFRATLVPIPVNGEPGVLVYQDDRLMAVVSLEFRDGLISKIHAIANPHKLAYVSSVIQGTPGSRSTPRASSGARSTP